MNNPHYTFVHSNFKLDGYQLNKEGLLRIAYSYIKDGEAFEKAAGDFILSWFDEKEFIKLQTSGTTGAPKTIQVNKQYMVNSALATGAFFDVQAGTKALLCLPVDYIAGKMMLVRAFILGWDIDITEPSGTLLEQNNSLYDFAAMVPLQAQQSMEKLGQIKKLILGGAKVSHALAQQLKNIPVEIYETYGMTETITHIAAKRAGEEAFMVLPDITISQDQRDCLLINAPNVNPEPVITNDVVSIINDKQFIWQGRADNVVNSGGIKLFPEQIEEKLLPYINSRFFIMGTPDETLGEKLILVVEGKPYKISDDVFTNFKKYERPKDIIFIEKFAETASGKVQRIKTYLNR